MACKIGKIVNIAAKILKVNQEMDELRTTVLQNKVNDWMLKHNLGCHSFLACVALMCQGSPIQWMVKLIICIKRKTKFLQVTLE